MSTMHEASKFPWTSNGSLEHINAGSLQRIADACEKMCTDHERLERDYKYMRESRDSHRATAERLARSNAALRGVIKRLKRAQP